jgi:RNA polymerase sigma factor (sigma-70 family)
MVRILVNQVISSGRRKRLESVPLEEAPESRVVGQEGPDPAVDTERLLDRESLQRALRDLPEDQRQVVTLRYFAELSVEETAAALGVRQGTVKSRLYRSMGRLRGILADQGALAPEPEGRR